MRYIRDYRKWQTKQEPEYKAYICNRYMSGGKQACSCNYINQKLLAQVVLEGLHRGGSILRCGNRTIVFM